VGGRAANGTRTEVADRAPNSRQAEKKNATVVDIEMKRCLSEAINSPAVRPTPNTVPPAVVRHRTDNAVVQRYTAVYQSPKALHRQLPRTLSAAACTGWRFSPRPASG